MENSRKEQSLSCKSHTSASKSRAISLGAAPNMNHPSPSVPGCRGVSPAARGPYAAGHGSQYSPTQSRKCAFVFSPVFASVCVSEVWLKATLLPAWPTGAETLDSAGRCYLRVGHLKTPSGAQAHGPGIPVPVFQRLLFDLTRPRPCDFYSGTSRKWFYLLVIAIHLFLHLMCKLNVPMGMDTLFQKGWIRCQPIAAGNGVL